METSKKLNFMKVKRSVLVWKQIEKRGDRIFMRLASRPLFSIKKSVRGFGTAGLGCDHEL